MQEPRSVWECSSKCSDRKLLGPTPTRNLKSGILFLNSASMGVPVHSKNGGSQSCSFIVVQRSSLVLRPLPPCVSRSLRYYPASVYLHCHPEHELSKREAFGQYLTSCHLLVLFVASARRDAALIIGLIWYRDRVAGFSNDNISFGCLGS